MFNIPPEVRATWPAPNYVNPETRGASLVVLSSIFIAFAIVMAILRCYTRIKITGSFGLDDVLISIAMIPTIGLAVCVLIANLKFGWNRHIWDLMPDDLTPGIQLSFASSIQFAAASALTKLSLLAFYHRLLPATAARKTRWFIVVYAVMTVVLSGLFIVSFIFSCKPIRAFWDFGPPTFRPDYAFKCHPHGVGLFRSSIINTINDFIVLLIPIPMVWRLKLPTRQRFLITGLFGLGLFVCVAGAVKTWFIYTGMIMSFDEPWDAYPLWIATTLEIDLGIICASGPAMRPFISQYMPKLLDQAARRFGSVRFSRNPIDKKMISSPVKGTYRKNNMTDEIDPDVRWSSITSTTALPDIPQSSVQDWQFDFKGIAERHSGVEQPIPLEQPNPLARRVTRLINFATPFRPSTDERDRKKSLAETIRVMMRSESQLPSHQNELQPVDELSLLQRESMVELPTTSMNRPQTATTLRPEHVALSSRAHIVSISHSPSHNSMVAAPNFFASQESPPLERPKSILKTSSYRRERGDGI